MSSKEFDQIVKEEFDYLIKDYGFSLVKCKKVGAGYEILFKNKTTGVKIDYEFREAYIFVTIYRLRNGKLVENPRYIKPDSVIHGFSLDDILALRNPQAIVRPAYEYPADSEFYDPVRGLTLYVRKFAQNLREYASELLEGDFRLFDKLEPIVRERALRLENSVS